MYEHHNGIFHMLDQCLLSIEDVCVLQESGSLYAIALKNCSFLDKQMQQYNKCLEYWYTCNT